jgi:multidrug efflux system membrane fusion protein
MIIEISTLKTNMLNRYKSSFTRDHITYLIHIPLILISVALLTILLSGCSGEEERRPMPSLPVKTAPVITLDVPITLSAVGTVESLSTVKISSRVSGLVTGQHVQEGENVEKGQLLFTIDDKPYQTMLASAKSNLERDRIKLEKALKDAARYADLLKKDYVTKSQAEQIEADAEALKAVVKGDEAALENAMLDLSYCSVRSPISGKAGAILIHEGNLVNKNDINNPLMVINQLQPVSVRFAAPEQYLSDIKARMAEHDLEVHANMPGQKNITYKGRLTFIDNAISADSGTVDLKAVFENSDLRLWPGMFVNVVLILGTKTGAIATPLSAVQMGQEGAYVYVLKSDMTVEQRKEKTGEQSDNHIIIESGVSPNETVVTDGQLMIYPGAKVTVINESKTAGDKQS